MPNDFTRGARFVVFGKWEWDARRHTFALRLNKPDEIEILPSLGPRLLTRLLPTKYCRCHRQRPQSPPTRGPEGAVRPVDDHAAEESDGDQALAAITSGRRVPVYRNWATLALNNSPSSYTVCWRQLRTDDIPETLQPSCRKRQMLMRVRSAALRLNSFLPGRERCARRVRTGRAVLRIAD